MRYFFNCTTQHFPSIEEITVTSPLNYTSLLSFDSDLNSLLIRPCDSLLHLRSLPTDVYRLMTQIALLIVALFASLKDVHQLLDLGCLFSSHTLTSHCMSHTVHIRPKSHHEL